MKIKILTFNIHKGFNWNNTQLTIERLKESIKGHGADIVFLQEVMGENKKLAEKFENWIENHFEYLADELWHDSVYSNHAIYDHRHHGNVILSRYPIIRHQVVDISLNPLEQRSMLFAELKIQGKMIHTFCTHLNLLHRDRIKQYKLIKEFINNNSADQNQLILAGDFNDWNQHASKYLMSIPHIHDAHKSLHGDYPKTFPSVLPFFKLDRVYMKGFEIQKAEVLKDNGWRNLSDHLPISIEVVIK